MVLVVDAVAGQAVLHVDHLAGLIALLEPRQRRNADLAEAIKLLHEALLTSNDLGHPEGMVS